MTLSAQDIQSQQFHVRFRGFDVEEVDDFLEKVSAAMQALNDENEKLKVKVESLEKDLASYHSQEKSFQSAIVAAQSIAEEMKEKSRSEGEKILAEAREEASKLAAEANGEVAALEKEIDRLSGLKGQIQEDLRNLLQSYMAMLEGGPAPIAAANAAVEVVERMSEEAITPPVVDLEENEEPLPEAPAEESEPEQAEAPEDDLSDLYVKVDLPDDYLESGPSIDMLDGTDDIDTDGMEEQSVELPPMPDGDLLTFDDEEEPEPAIPDLEGDMVFDLEDPLDDDDAPSIDLEEDLEDLTKKKDDFDPNESPL